jgi:hypothetical protein
VTKLGDLTVLDEILLGVPVEELNLEDDIGVGDPLRHVKVPPGSHPSAPNLYLMRFSSVFLLRKPILRMTLGLGIPSAMCKSPRESTISTYLIFMRFSSMFLLRNPIFR